MSSFSHGSQRVALLAICIIFCSSNILKAQLPAARFWTTVGSAGTVDEADVAKVVFDRATAQVGRRPLVIGGTAAAAVAAPSPSPSSSKAAASAIGQTTSGVIRYNVTPVDGLFETGDGTSLELRYLDVGGSAQVIVELFEVDMATGTRRSMVKFDSNANNNPSADRYRFQNVIQCGAGFDFQQKAYYLDATLTSNAVAVGSAAGIEIIKVRRVSCLPF